MKLEFVHLVANCEVALGHSELHGFNIHPVASQPVLMAKQQHVQDGEPSDVKVPITNPGVLLVLILAFSSSVRPEV